MMGFAKSEFTDWEKDVWDQGVMSTGLFVMIRWSEIGSGYGDHLDAQHLEF